jgi:hypothetical protein
MKTPEEISKRIRENIEHAIRFPKMWFRDPESMEMHLMFLTNLLSFMHERNEGQYTDYLVSKGYQSNNYTNRLKENEDVDDNEIFSRFAVFFKDFFDKFDATLLK